MNLIYQNIISNYIGKVWGFLSVFVFVPVYIKILGIESYSIISFYTVILTILLFADAGLSATLSREMAKTSDKVYLGNLLHTIERLYLGICFIVIILILSGADLVAINWLKTSIYSQSELSTMISIMGASVALQLFSTMYNSGLMGLQKQVKANILQVSFSFARSGLVLLPLFFWPTLWTYFFWQLAVNIIFLLLNRTSLWAEIRIDKFEYVFKPEILKTVGRFALGMMTMAILSSLNTQLDKIVVGKLLSLVEFGYYSLAGTLSQMPIIVITPIAIAILPTITKLSHEKDKSELKVIFHQYASIISILACAVCLPLLLFSEQLVYLWTSDLVISKNIKFVTKILTLGSLFLSMQYMPYHLAIANGHTRTNILLSILGLLCTVPILFFVLNHFGFEAAGFPWLFLNSVFFLILGYLIINRFLSGAFLIWLFKDIGLPLMVNVIIGLLIGTSGYLPRNHFETIIVSTTIGAISIGLTFILHNILFKKWAIQLKSFYSH